MGRENAFGGGPTGSSCVHSEFSLACFLPCLQIVRGMSSGAQHDLFVHYIFMDNACELPTGAGLQLQVAFSGVATPGAKVGVKLSSKSVSLIRG